MSTDPEALARLRRKMIRETEQGVTEMLRREEVEHAAWLELIKTIEGRDPREL